jgi:hypothetical protein
MFKYQASFYTVEGWKTTSTYPSLDVAEMVASVGRDRADQSVLISRIWIPRTEV